MTVHEQFAEDLALYALGSLEGDERTSLEKHLEGCASCRRELEQLRGDAALLALTTAGPKPPVRARSRLMDAIAEEPRAERTKAVGQWWGILGWLVAAAMLVVAVTLSRQNTHLSSTVVKLTGEVERQRADSEQARRIAELLKAPDASSYEVLPVKMNTPPPPAGKAIFSPKRNTLVFMASNLNPLPPTKAYELWLIPKQGAPIPAGVFKPDARGSAIVVNPPLPAGVEAAAFAITIEPEQGSVTPTMPIVMMGKGG